jgi:hypothetical protein
VRCEEQWPPSNNVRMNSEVGWARAMRPDRRVFLAQAAQGVYSLRV